MKMILLVASILTLPGTAEETATATWIAESVAAKQGESIRTVLAMKVSEGWHTYWENPGEGGMPLEIKTTLPEGWKAGALQYPTPIRFMTGDLPGFGYRGEIHFPLTLTPPPGFDGNLPQITASLSWLACTDEACLPGKAELTLIPGEAPTIAKAHDELPKPIPGAKLGAAAQGENILLTLTAPQDFDASIYEIFPATRNVIDPAAKPHFAKTDDGTWTATAPKSEYLEGEPKALSLVLATPGKSSWKICTTD